MSGNYVTNGLGSPCTYSQCDEKENEQHPRDAGQYESDRDRRSRGDACLRTGASRSRHFINTPKCRWKDKAAPPRMPWKRRGAKKRRCDDEQKRSGLSDGSWSFAAMSSPLKGRMHWGPSIRALVVLLNVAAVAATEREQAAYKREIS